MALSDLFCDFLEHLHSPKFHQLARHVDHPTAFTRCRKLPLPTLVAVMLTGLCKSVQAELDQFFAHLHQQAQLLRHVSEQAFAQARAKLSPSALPALNDRLVGQLEHAGLLPRWHGLRLVAGDASPVRFGLRGLPRAPRRVRRSDRLRPRPARRRGHARRLAAHRPRDERQMLFERLERLRTDDLLLLDRGYPARWLLGVLKERTIPFCMRVEMGKHGGFLVVREFLRSGLAEQVVSLAADPQDVADYGCPARPRRPCAWCATSPPQGTCAC